MPLKTRFFMTQYQNILIAFESPIATLTISREKALNALNGVTMNELAYFFTEGYKEFEHLRGVIITGAGEKSFVAGADITEFLSLGDKSGADVAQRGQSILFLIENFHLPVIAAVNGFALGGGCELAMACHLRVASTNAKFGQPEVNLGILPGYGGTQRLVQLIGKGKALELMMTADMIDAEEAHRLGLVNHVVPVGETVAKAKEILLKISTKAPIAITQTIFAVNAHFAFGGAQGYAAEIQAFGLSAASSDFKEGATAFVEKRKANFKGF